MAVRAREPQDQTSSMQLLSRWTETGFFAGERGPGMEGRLELHQFLQSRGSASIRPRCLWTVQDAILQRRRSRYLLSFLNDLMDQFDETRAIVDTSIQATLDNIRFEWTGDRSVKLKIFRIVLSFTT
jgi:hypothetical protein